jgi:hypothetical protein
LIETHTFKIPSFVVESEAKNIASQSGIPWTSMNSDQTRMYLDQGERNAKLSFILDSVREQEPESVLNDMEAQQYLTKHLQSRGTNIESLTKNPNGSMVLQSLLASVKDEYTLQWIVDQSTIVS